jgi:hypothetical protein
MVGEIRWPVKLKIEFHERKELGSFQKSKESVVCKFYFLYLYQITTC